jgi:hypothetical protein
VDFWDINDMASKILAVLHYSSLNNELKQHGAIEVRNMTWDKPAAQCINIYGELLRIKRGG